jgi:hypothetical protein
MSSTKQSKSQSAARAALMIVGMGKHYANVSSLTIDGVPTTPAQATASLQALVDLRKGVNDARATTQSKVAAERAQAPALRSFMAALVTIVKGSFGSSPDVLADFGLAPKKVRTPLTVQQKATATAKQKATRAARHTMGPKQRNEVKGDVTGVLVTPVTSTAPATPAPSTRGDATTPAAASTAIPSAPVQGATATPSAPHGA